MDAKSIWMDHSADHSCRWGRICKTGIRKVQFPTIIKHVWGGGKLGRRALAAARGVESVQ